MVVDGAASLGSSLAVTGAAALSSTLAVTGAASLAAQLNVAGPSNLNNSLAVAGASQLNSTLAVAGAATFQDNVIVNGNLTILGTQTSINTTSLEVKDNAVLISDGNVTDTVQAGIQMQYKPVGAPSALYAGLKRIPVTGQMVFFKDAAMTIEEEAAAASPAADIYAGLIADSFSCASDLNLKKNIVALDGALDKIDGMRGVYHDWIDENQSQDRQIGVIAQEVQAVYPELVATGANGYLSVNYPKLTAVLLQSVKELKAMVLELAAKQQ
jgi:hypothetical protein